MPLQKLDFREIQLLELSVWDFNSALTKRCLLHQTVFSMSLEQPALVAVKSLPQGTGTTSCFLEMAKLNLECRGDRCLGSRTFLPFS